MGKFPGKVLFHELCRKFALGHFYLSPQNVQNIQVSDICFSPIVGFPFSTCILVSAWQFLKISMTLIGTVIF